MTFLRRVARSLPVAISILLMTVLILTYNNISFNSVPKIVSPVFHFEYVHNSSENNQKTINYANNGVKTVPSFTETCVTSNDLNKTESNNKESVPSNFNESIITIETLAVLKSIIDCRKTSFESEVVRKKEFVVYANFVKADHGDLECYEDVTIATHGGFTFLDNLEILVQRWSAPLSIAIFAPGTDFSSTLESIKYLRQCSSQKSLIKKWVTFHIYFHEKYPPENIVNDPLAGSYVNCSLPAPYAVDYSTTFKHVNHLEYPVNVGRNIARDRSLTHYVLSLDIELYPTPSLGRIFLNMIARKNYLIAGNQPRVFAIKPFEIRKSYEVPANKVDLLKMLNNKTAIVFHMKVCPRCHISPLTKEWIAQGETKYMEITGVGKRLHKFINWEAVFICTKNDPKFDERLTWEGKGDKMSQSFILCLLDYDFLILSNAFVVHQPGIKIYHKEPAFRRNLVRKQNKLIAEVITKEYFKMFGRRKGCQF